MADPNLVLRLENIASPEWTAGGIYLLNLLRTLASLPASERPRMLAAHAGEPEAAELLAAFSPGRLRRLWERLPGAAPKPDLLFPVFTPGDGPTRRLYWIPDLQHVHLPELFSEEERKARDEAYRSIAASEATLLLSSRAAKADFEAFAPNACVRRRVWSFLSVLEFNPEHDPAETQLRTPEKYLYLPNQFWAHKNHRVVFEALAIARDRGATVPLVCTGRAGDYRRPGHYDSLMRIIADNHLEGVVSLLGLIPRAAQIDVYRRAAAVIQPSLFEGWNTSVEDVKAIGRPLFLSDIPVHREQAPAGAHFFPPHDPQALAELLVEHFSQLAPGPDKAAERAAVAANHALRLVKAREFMDIAWEAAGKEKP